MRVYDWPEKLHASISEAKTQAFEWGTHDCACFVSDCVEAMTGVDPLKEYRGKYSTALGAIKALKTLANVEDLPALATSFWGEDIEVSHASRGDVVLIDHEGNDNFGVIVGTHAVFLTQEGVISIPVNKCKAAWKIV